MSIDIRPEVAGDREAVFAVNAAAFPTDAEARLVDRLRAEAEPYRAWVAHEAGTVVGHIVFTPVMAVPERGEPWQALGLAPMAVAPSHQRHGIGSRLVRTTLTALDQAGHRTVFVLGHPAYYPRFGFVPAIDHGWRYAPGTEHAFFVRTLVEIRHGPGTIRYHAAVSR